MAGSVRITGVNASIPVVVDLNTTGTPTEFAAFSDAACTQSVSLPATITTDTTFYVKATGAVVLSVKVDGTELAGTRVFLSNAGPVGFALDTDPRNTDTHKLIGLISTHSVPVAWTTTKTAAYTAASGDGVLADASGGDFNVTLPAPIVNARVTVKNIGATGTVTVLPSASEKIDGADTSALSTQWTSRNFQSNGTNWFVI